MAKRKIRKRKQHYDLVMIKAFLQHFRWEYAINHFENTQQGDVDDVKISPDLLTELEKCIKKYNTKALMMALMVFDEDLSEEDAKQAKKALRNAQAKSAQEVLDALDTLEKYLEEAFVCAARPNDLPVKKIRLADMLEEDTE